MKAKLLHTQEVRISDIDVSGRLRPVSELSVLSLMASLEALGQQSEIHIRKIRHQGGRLKLILGAHRVEAHVRLGCTSIKAKIWDCTDSWAELAEIDDNLAHSDLTPLDLAIFLSRRKVAYEKEHPAAKHGGLRGNQHTGGRQNDMLSFCQSVAEQRSMSTRQIERFVAAGQGLDAHSIALLRQSPNRVTLSDLQVLGKCGDPVAREMVCRAMSTGAAKNAAGALRAYKAPPGQKALSDEDQKYLKINEAWTRASKAAKRQFVTQRAAELRALLLDADEGSDDAS